MKIQYCSDLHLEFKVNEDFIKSNPLKVEADILILAGDILPLVHLNQINDFISLVSDNYKQVYWIPGNHEYYHYDLADLTDSFHKQIKPNVHLLNNKKIVIKDVSFFFTTLWSHIKPQNAFPIQQSVSDFHVIEVKNKLLTPSHFNALHKTSLTFLEEEIKKTTTAKNVVVTHHVPTFINYPPQFKNSPINEAFAVELHDFIYDSKVDYWIYGHHHRNIKKFSIGKTKLITNQLGYVERDEHFSFKSDAVITI